MVAAELLKVRKRWLPYVLFLVMVIGAALIIWLIGYASWRSSGTQLESQGVYIGADGSRIEERTYIDDEGQLIRERTYIDDEGHPITETFVSEGPAVVESEINQPALHTFALPWSLTALLDGGQFWGAILVGIFVASMVATEHGWGTVRQALVRGQTRSQYLTAKLLGVTLAATIGLLAALAIGLGFSLIATAVADQPITFDVPGGLSIVEALFMVLRAGYTILPYALLAFCLAVVGRSTTLGVVGILLFLFMEAILVAILGNLGGLAPDIRAFTMGHNVTAILATNRIGGADYFSFAPRPTPSSFDLPDPAVAALVLALYCLVFLAVTYAVFQRRDLQ